MCARAPQFAAEPQNPDHRSGPPRCSIRPRAAAEFDQVDRGFAEMRGRFDQTAAGMAQIVELLTVATTSSQRRTVSTCATHSAGLPSTA